MSTSTIRNSKTTAFTGNKSRKGGPAPSSIGSHSRMGRSVYGGASRTALSSSSRKNVQLAAGSDKLGGRTAVPVQVFDDDGSDVTPMPLLQLDPETLRKNQANILADSSGDTPSDLMSQASIYQTGTQPFTRSLFSVSQSGHSSASIEGSVGEPAETLHTWTESKVTYQREEIPEQLTDSDLEKVVTLNLSETPTIWLLDMPGVSISLDNEDAPAVRQQNAKYEELLKSRAGNDLYVERGMNTFNNARKVKHVQTTKIGYADTGVNASNWDMYDTYKIEDEKKKEEEESEEAETTESQTAVASTKTGTDSVFASKESGVTAVQEEENIAEDVILENENFVRDLQVMERAINLNYYQPRQASYRGYDVVEDMDKLVAEASEQQLQQQSQTATKDKASDKKQLPTAVASVIPQDLGPNIDRLWEYKCPLTKGRNISCIVWNKENPDLLAVGYGQFEFSKQKEGVVCCWSLKNPEFPERVYKTEAGVTAMDFSVAHTNLLAVGMYNGTVAIFNVRSKKNEAILESVGCSGRHTGPVWQLKWIEKERGSDEKKIEVLVSVSTDGRVTQWSVRKGFESYDLIKLKRIAVKTIGGKQKKTEALISKFAGGLCFDFNAKDSNVYLVGTEEGHIHRCSCSYNEQYLDSYVGHTGPIYGVQWCPFAPEVFLSCSADWSLRLWNEERTEPVLNFFSSTKSVLSACWSPHCATVFACVNEGAVEVWDLKQSTLDPIITNTPASGVKLSSVTFAKNSECILVGDSEGQVTVYQLRGMPEPPAAELQAETLHDIINSTLASQLQPKK